VRSLKGGILPLREKGLGGRKSSIVVVFEHKLLLTCLLGLPPGLHLHQLVPFPLEADHFVLDFEHPLHLKFSAGGLVLALGLDFSVFDGVVEGGLAEGQSVLVGEVAEETSAVLVDPGLGEGYSAGRLDLKVFLISQA
jgi:hypothetical protein